MKPLADRARPKRRRLSGKALKAQAELAAKLYQADDEPSMAEVGRGLGISERQVLRYLRMLEVPARPARRRAKYPQPEPRKCANPRCDVIFTPKKPAYVASGRGKYHSKACFDDDQRIYPEPGERECQLSGCTNRFRPDPWLVARGFGLFCCEDHYWASSQFHTMITYRARESWRIGGNLARAALESSPWVKGRARQRWLGRWAGRAAGRLGGRRRGYTDEQVRVIRIMRTKDPTIGRIRLARAADCTEKQVRAILAELDGLKG